MEAKHTLGPWTYEGDHTHRQYNIRMMGHMIGGHICTVNNLPTDVLANRDPGIAAANAALISAAPEMLAALEWAVDTADAEQYEADWYADARMAIAKAKGRVK